MLNANLSCVDAIKKNYRHYSLSASLEMVNLSQDKSVALRADFARWGSAIEQILNTQLDYVENRMHIGMCLGKKIWPAIIASIPHSDGYCPPTYTTSSLCGYIGQHTEDSRKSHGNEVISIRFSQRNLKKICIKFAKNRIPRSFFLQILDKYGKIIWKKVFTDALLKIEEWVDLLGNQAQKIQMIITQPPASGLRTHLLVLSPRYPIQWSDRDISECKISRSKTDKTPSQGSVISSILDLKIFNEQRNFDLANKKSPYYQNLREGASLYLSLQMWDSADHKKILQELLLGVFYIKEWHTSEETAIVQIKASDLIDFSKTRRLYGPLFEKIPAYTAFFTFAQAIGLKSCIIQGKNSHRLLENISLDGKAGEVIQNLCIQTLSFAYVSENGENLIVTEMQGLPAVCRYPLREFGLSDFAEYSEKVASRPNTFHCQYSLLEFEGDTEGERLLSAGYSPRINYTEMFESSFEKSEDPLGPFFFDRFPEDMKNQYWNRPIGADQKISWEGEFATPDRFIRLEFSDEFVYEVLEYQWDYVRDQNGTILLPQRVWWKVWLFQYESETDIDKVLTLYTVIRPKVRKLLSHTEMIPACPSEYKIPKIDMIPNFNIHNLAAVRQRNSLNEPYVFDVVLSEKTALNQVVPQNYYREGFFEFTLEPYSHGVRIEVWNYSQLIQNFEIDLYGRKIIESEKKYRQTLTIPELVIQDGIIEQEISLPSASNSEIAQLMLKNLASYHQCILGSADLIPWSDPRIGIGDRVSFNSIRNYEKKEALIDGITLEYNGILKQKMSVSLVKKANRDCRVYGGFSLCDRPQYSRKLQIYPNDGIY
ncbi:MAG: hypothetical protein ACRCVN_05095 [Spirochaetia bacterium]